MSLILNRGATSMFLRIIRFILVMLIAYMSYAAAIAYSYDLGSRYGLMDTVGSPAEQRHLVLRTAVVGSAILLLPLWIVMVKLFRPWKIAVVAAFVTEACVAAYACAGFTYCGFDDSPYNFAGMINFLFPSTLFSEFNWLTFIFEVGPATACAVGLTTFALSLIHIPNNRGLRHVSQHL